MQSVRHLICLLFVALFSLAGSAQSQSGAAERLLALANQTRAAHGLGMLAWDPALAHAAELHCRRQAAEGAISHQFPGEAELSERAAAAKARFTLIEENVAVTGSADRIHTAWMNSPGHRANLLNSKINRVGIAVVADHGSLYAVADYSEGVPTLSREDAESKISALLAQRGLQPAGNVADARMACAVDHPRSRMHAQGPRMIFRWDSGDLDHLPAELISAMKKGAYSRAAVGNCSAGGEDGPFTSYHMAVLLY